MEIKFNFIKNIAVRLLLSGVILLSCYIQGYAQVVTATAKQHQTAVEYVDPLIGTFSTTALSAGNTYPTISRPFGMHTWSPQTGNNEDRGLYTYQSNYIYGFRQTRQASYWIGDYGQFSLMPVSSVNQFTEESRKSWFSHKAETVTPYYYKVYLGDHHAHVALTATERAAIFKIDFHSSDSAFIVVDAFKNGSFIKISPDRRTVEGYSTVNQGGVPSNFRNYFVMQFSEPFISAATWRSDSLFKARLESAGDHAGAIIGFENSNGKSIAVKVASSFISFEQAYLNLKELGEYTFEQVKQQSKQAWNKHLQKIWVEGATSAQLRTFYSAFYRMLIFPRKFYEINKAGNPVYYSPFSGKIRNGKLYADNGFWDTYRAQFPFLNLFFPEIVSEVVESMANTYKESGWLPEWFSPGHRDCMIGSHSASIIADAYLKGIKIADIGLLYKAILQNTVKAGPISSLGRLGASYYNRLGYVPYDAGINQNVSRTLEYAYDDFAIYQLANQLAKALGKDGRKDMEQSDVFLKRSENYKNLYDPATGLMRPRDSSGAFIKDFDPFKWGDHFTEGNSWQYSWSVPQDPLGLARLMGGTKAFVSKLDSVFSLPPVFDISYYKRGIIHLVREMQGVDMGQYAHLNEPMHHVAYLYNYGAPWKAQYWVRQIMDRLYSDAPDGYPGEEDNGQMSAWYVFSALGFYPVNPVSNQYVFGSPLFKKAILRLGNGKTLEISALSNSYSNSNSNYYIQSVKFNNLSHRFNWINYEDLSKGGKLIFEMGGRPNFNRAVAEKDFPFSTSALK